MNNTNGKDEKIRNVVDSAKKRSDLLTSRKVVNGITADGYVEEYIKNHPENSVDKCCQTLGDMGWADYQGHNIHTERTCFVTKLGMLFIPLDSKQQADKKQKSF